MTGKSYDEINKGDTASFTKTVSETDVYLYAGITGDFNPLHIDEVYAQKFLFKKRIAHGLLTGGLISTVLGAKLPGPGTIYVSQFFNFKMPVYIGDTITAIVEVIEKIEEKKWLRLKTECLNSENKIVLTGEALVIPPRKPGGNDAC